MLGNEAKKYIDNANSIYIVSHVNPDGDAVGSAFSMYHALKNMGKNVQVIMPKYSSVFDFLEDIKEVKSDVKEDKFDLLICVDASDRERLSISDEDYAKARNVILIDHHIEKDFVVDAKVVDSIAPANTQVIYEFFKEQNISIDKSIATYIYLGLLTDTGSFNYPRTTSKTYRIAAECIDMGVPFEYICSKINDTIKESKLNLISYGISKMESYMDGKVRYTQIELSQIEGFGVSEEDAEGVTNYLRMIEGTEVAIYVRGVPNDGYKVSLRSKEMVDVSKIAMHFGGGGHVRAAGFNVSGEMDKIKEELLEIIGKELV